MAEESKYINPDHPVYFSYAGNDESNPDCDLEKIVKDLRSLFDREHIYYLEYKSDNTPFEPGKPYVKSEEEIGKGEFIVVVLSDKYIHLDYNRRTTLHCMYEWHCIVQRPDFEKHIFTFLAEGDNIKNTFRTPSIMAKFKKRYDKKFDKITDTYLDGKLDNKLERKYYNAGKDAFKIDLDKMKAFVENAPTFNKKCLESLVNKIKDRIAKLYPQPITTEPVDVSNETVASPSRPFDSIVFSYDEPTTTSQKKKEFFGRKKFVENLHSLFFEKEQNSINVVAKGGMGKTSIAYIYVEKYSKEYKNIQFVVSNDDILTDFNDELSRRICKVDYYKSKFPRQEDMFSRNIGEEERKRQIENVRNSINDALCDADSNFKNLLVIDVNIDKEGLQSVYMPKDVKDKWHILYLSREKIVDTYHLPLLNFKDQDDDFDGARELFQHIYTRETFAKDKMEELLDKVFYHPLLIEQLAQYGMDCEYDYDKLYNVVAVECLNPRITEKFTPYSITYKGKEHDIMVYIQTLFNIKRYKDDEQYVIMHFASWEYDYISFNVISELLKLDRGILRKTLNDLVDKVIFLKTKSSDADGYRIHGLLKERLKEDIKMYDGYGDYFDNVKRLIENNKVDGEVQKCIKNIDKIYIPWLNRLPHIAYPPERTDRKGHKFVCIPVRGYGDIKMMKVSGGKFQMNSSYRVAVSDFYLAETPVTQELWKAVIGDNPSIFIGDKFPVENVSWYDCLAFIMKLNKETHLRFRLPTEVEWEYAAGWRKDGRRNQFSGTDDEDELDKYAWYIKNSGNIIHPVATDVSPNSLGIYDMSGNVWEWCQDWYGVYPSGSVINPTGPVSGSRRVLRGGSWNLDALSCHVFIRGWNDPGSCSNFSGFRLSLSSQQKKEK